MKPKVHQKRLLYLRRFWGRVVGNRRLTIIEYLTKLIIKGSQTDKLPPLRQISERFHRFVANRGECRNKERRKTRKNMVEAKIPRNFAVSKGKQTS